jgi:hypothetical protein
VASEVSKPLPEVWKERKQKREKRKRERKKKLKGMTKKN